MRIALLLPEESDLGGPWRARALASVVLGSGLFADANELEICIGLPREPAKTWDRKAEFIKMDEQNISVRPVVWRQVEAAHAARIYPELETISEVSHYAVPQDGGWNFADADAWVVFASVATGAVIPIRPTAYYCRGLPTRYVSGLFGDIHTDPAWERQIDSFLAWRRARAVAASEPSTIADLISFAGVSRSKIISVPALWTAAPPLPQPSEPLHLKAPYILWIAEPTPEHDLQTGMTALQKYLQLGGRRDVVLAGSRISEIDPSHLARHSISRQLARDPELLARIRFEAVQSFDELGRLAAGAACIWSNHIADGEPDAPRIAAALNRPFVGPRYPQAVSAAQDLDLLYDLGDAGACAQALLDAESFAPRDAGRPLQQARPVREYAAFLEALVAHG